MNNFLIKTIWGDFKGEFFDNKLVGLQFPGDFANPPGDFDYLPENLYLVQQQISEYIEGKRKNFTFDYLLLNLTKNYEHILFTLKDRVEYGKTVSYSELAALSNIKSPRVAGNCMAKNPLPLIFPCHRVIKKNGDSGQFGPGLFYKEKLLVLESS